MQGTIPARPSGTCFLPHVPPLVCAHVLGGALLSGAWSPPPVGGRLGHTGHPPETNRAKMASPSL